MQHKPGRISLMLAVAISAGCWRDGPLLIHTSVEESSITINSITPVLMDKADVVGLSVVIIRSNRVIIDKSFGYSDLETKKSVDNHTVYKAASLGKPIFAYIVVTLAMQNKIDLDKPLYSYAEILKN